MKTLIPSLLLILAGSFIFSCSSPGRQTRGERIRPLADTVGFAHLDWQTDSVMARIDRTYSAELSALDVDPNTAWRVAICPHDDYTYTSWLYPAVLRNLKAKTVIIFGVAHKAKQLDIYDRIVFDSFPYWHGPYQKIKASPLREELTAAMPEDLYIVSDSLQTLEHSVESMLPFLQYFNRDVEIVSILVPYMDAARMEEISKPLAAAIANATMKHRLEWGKDIALLITSDAVHYGDEEWGGKNMAPFGTDSTGYAKAVEKEHAIIDSCLAGELTREKAKRFFGYTVQPGDYREYQWTWCGRYSIPLGLMTAVDLREALQANPLSGKYLAYTTSIDHPPLPVSDLRMGITAIATMRHWVGYAAVGYE